MIVNALDHINIIAKDLDKTARFYVDLLDLVRKSGPHPLTPDEAQWMYDPAGHAIIHLNSEHCPGTYKKEVSSGPSGRLHHVALNCTGFDEVIGRLDAHNTPYQVHALDSIGLRQIFVTDPNDIVLELNFFGN